MLGGQPQDRRGLGMVLSGQLGQAHLPTGGVLGHGFSLVVRRIPEALTTSQQQALMLAAGWPCGDLPPLLTTRGIGALGLRAACALGMSRREMLGERQFAAPLMAQRPTLRAL